MKSIWSKSSKTLEYMVGDKYIKILAGILILGAVLRYYGIFNAENVDEYNEVFEALRVASGKFNYERMWKKGYQNILAIEYGIYFITGYLINVFRDPMDFAGKIVQNMEPLFLIGRYTTATLGTLSVGLIYLIGRRTYSPLAGLFASATLCVSAVHVWTSHLVNTDVPLVFFFLLATYFITKFFYSGKTVDYVLASFFGAWAISVKMIGVGTGIIFIVSHIIRCKHQGRKIAQYIYCKEIFFSLVAFILGLAITNPPIIFTLGDTIRFHYGVYQNVYDEVPYAMGGSGHYTYMVLLLRELGLPLFILTIVSIAYALYKRETWDYIFILFVGGTYLMLGGTAFLVQERYLMIIMVALFVLNGRFLDVVVRKPFAGKRYGSLILTATALLVLGIPLSRSVGYVRTLTQENTGKASKRWIENNVPANSKLLIDTGRTIISSGPRLNESKENLERKLRIIKNLRQGETYDSRLTRIVDSSSSIYFELLLKNIPEVTYDITTTELGRKVETFEYYRKEGYQYIITNDEVTWRAYDKRWAEKYPVSSRFYRNIDKEFEVLKEFKPSPTRSGPTIIVYKVK
ncbi:MAG: glycosyltransferase family 39 protein [Deltaproteobacteria bacterium]